MIYFACATFVVFGFLQGIWAAQTRLDQFVKSALFFMAMWAFAYIVRTPGVLAAL